MRKAIPGAVVHMPFNVLGAIAMLVIAVGTLVDVGLRHFGAKPLPSVIEYSSLLIVAVVYLSLSSRELSEGHIRITLLVDRMPQRARRQLDVVTDAISVGVIALVLLQTLQTALDSRSSGELMVGVEQVLVWPARILIPIGLFMLIVAIAQRAWVGQPNSEF